jgi:hypothetical protein
VQLRQLQASQRPGTRLLAGHSFRKEPLSLAVVIWASHGCPVLLPVLRHCQGYLGLPELTQSSGRTEVRPIVELAQQLLTSLTLKRQQRRIGGRACLPGTGLVMADIVRRLVERRLPELVVTGVTGHPEVPYAPTALSYLSHSCADAGHPTCAMPGHSE